MSEGPRRVTTGNSTLDLALGGGAPAGQLLLFHGEEGAGAAELAFLMLRTAAQSRPPRRATWLSAQRSGERVAREAAELFDATKAIEGIRFQRFRPRDVQGECVSQMGDAGTGDVLVIESAGALTHLAPSSNLVEAMQGVAEVSFKTGVVVVLLVAAGTLPAQTEALLGETADGILRFRWREGETMRRRIMTIEKMRGLVEILDGEEIPRFEVGLHRGRAFMISQVTNVV